jgi:hypothetical protein
MPCLLHVSAFRQIVQADKDSPREVRRVTQLALASKPSVDFSGY